MLTVFAEQLPFAVAKKGTTWKPIDRPNLKEVGVAEGGAEAEDEVALGVFGNGLHDGAVDDDEVLGRRLDVAAVEARVARVEEQRRALQADPVAAPAALPR